MDGVLIDTADAVHDAYTDWANSNDLDPDEVLEIVHGRRTVEVAAHFGLDDDVGIRHLGRRSYRRLWR